MLASVHHRPPPSATCTNTIRANAGERSRTGISETETESDRRLGSSPVRRRTSEGRCPVSVEAIFWALHLARSRPAGRAAVHRVQVRARRPGQPRRAGRHGRVPVGGHAGPLYRAVRADGPHLPGPTRGRGHHRTVRPRHRRGPDQARRPPPAGLGLEPQPGPDDLDAAAVAVLEHQFSALGARLAAAAQPGADGQAPGCHHRTPVPPAARLWITGPAGCNRCTRCRERGATGAPTGCNLRSHGVQRLHPNRPRNRA